MAGQLVLIPEVERLSASVVRILAGNPGKVCYSIVLASILARAVLNTSKMEYMLTHSL